MNPQPFRPSLRRPSNYARLCIVWACTLCFSAPLCSVADDVAQINARVLEILYLQQALRTSVVDGIEPDVDGIANALAYLNHNNDDQLALLSAIAGAVTNRPGGVGGDVLAGNPWWATNSAFVLDFNDYARAYPDDGSSAQMQVSFPQLLSIWSARLQTRTPRPSGLVDGGWAQYWGVDDVRTYGDSGIPGAIRRGYTWFDWMSDAMRSNWVLQANLAGLAGTTDAPGVVDTAAQSAVDDGSTDGTNGVPEMVIEEMDVGGVEASLELFDAQAVGDMLPAEFSGASPEIVVFAGGRYGDVDVPEVRASLAIPEDVARYIRGVATWLWRVALFVGCFVIVRQEVAYWSTLGGSTSDA